MAPIVGLGPDVHGVISQYLCFEDLVGISSTCVTLRDTYRHLAFATLWWRRKRPPPKSLWRFFKHLHMDVDADSTFVYEFLKNLDGLESLHITSTTVSYNLMNILRLAPHIQVLDLGRLNWTTPEDIVEYPPLPGFQPIPCRPRVLKFCSSLNPSYTYFNMFDAYGSRMRAQRFPLLTLLRDIGIARLESLEVCLEALSLPFAVAYTWSSLRELVLTGLWIHPGNDRETLEDERLGIPVAMYECVHLGSLLVACPLLTILRVRWRSATWLKNPGCIVWPAAEPLPPPNLGVLAMLNVLELRNSSATDGIFSLLPPSLRSLSLLTHPHTTEREDLTLDNSLENSNRRYGAAMTPSALVSVLSAVPLPELRALHLSFCGPMDTRLFQYIAASFPRLEVFEFHAELSPGYVWSARELRVCADALVPLTMLRVLRLNTFRCVNRSDQPLTSTIRGDLSQGEIAAALFGETTGACRAGTLTILVHPFYPKFLVN
ncbi:hypothetical protein EV714DRAFT_216805 [Schizophyllum commune]